MLISVMIKEFSFFGRRKIIRWWENVETYIYLTIEIGVSFFLFFLGLAGGWETGYQLICHMKEMVLP